MRPDEWWKNFGLGTEVDAAGAFIFNGIRFLHSVNNFYYPVDTFEVLYNLSVGLERLLKVGIVLAELNESIDIDKIEESLITHNTQDLLERLNANRDLELADIHREFVALLSKFYKSHRYARYSLRSVPDIEQEKSAFLRFLGKHLGIDVDNEDFLSPIRNTDQIRRFLGKAVQRIAKSVFRSIQKDAHRLNIYTDELRGDSKALKVFYGDRLDFIDETRQKKEIILWLMDPETGGSHVNLLRSFGSLDLDPALGPDYIEALIDESRLPFVADEIDELYTELESVKDRIQMIDCIDKQLQFDDDLEGSS